MPALYVFSDSLSGVWRNKSGGISAAGKSVGKLSCTSAGTLCSDIISVFYGCLQRKDILQEADFLFLAYAFAKTYVGRRLCGAGGPVDFEIDLLVNSW